MKLLFLDVDGVLNYNKKDATLIQAASGLIKFVEPEKMRLLKKIVNESGAKIVLTSTWRYGCEKVMTFRPEEKADYEALVAEFQKYGLEIFDVTPTLCYEERGLEIKAWILGHEDVGSICIIDDKCLSKKEHKQPFGRYFVQTTKEKGLCQNHVRQVLKTLALTFED